MNGYRTLAKVTALWAILCSATVASAQWRTERFDALGMKFQVSNRLERLPMRLDDRDPYLRARMRPSEVKDLVNGTYQWGCDVYEFTKKADDMFSDEHLADLSEEMREHLKKLQAMIGASAHTSFESWLNESSSTEVLRNGKARSGSGKKPGYRQWEWIRPSGRIQEYCAASVFDLQDREVAIVVSVPLLRSGKRKPKSKWMSIIKRMLKSGRIIEASEESEDTSRDKFADTETKQSALSKAKQNIGNLKGWDYYTTPNYIVLYSWDFRDPSDRAKSKQQAKFYSSRLEKMRDFFIQHYPLGPAGLRGVAPDPSAIPSPDGPTTGGGDKDEPPPRDEDAPIEGKDKPTYSIFRLCATEEQFQQYGQSPPGVVGWFSPASKELVVFLGGDKRMGKGATETVTYHEGWHQFADLYFSNPSGRDGNLHRWFDEGHGDFFGAYRPKGKRFSYVGSAMRHDSVQRMVRDGDYVPFKEIVTWSRRRFYGQNAPYYYAQAFSMIDYLRRGAKLKRHWKPEYGEILDMYRKVMLVYFDSDRAVRTAFRNFKDEDWVELEEAWKAWVDSPHFKRG